MKIQSPRVLNPVHLPRVVQLGGLTDTEGKYFQTNCGRGCLLSLWYRTIWGDNDSELPCDTSKLPVRPSFLPSRNVLPNCWPYISYAQVNGVLLNRNKSSKLLGLWFEAIKRWRFRRVSMLRRAVKQWWRFWKHRFWSCFFPHVSRRLKLWLEPGIYIHTYKSHAFESPLQVVLFQGLMYLDKAAFA